MLNGNVVNEQFVASALPPSDPAPAITQKMLSTFAMNQYADVESEALKVVNSMKEKWGSGVSTLITLYNASGKTLIFNRAVDAHGHVGSDPYDSFIQNGQASAVLHVKTSGTATGSSAAVAYNIEGTDLLFVLVFENPFNHNASNPKAHGFIQTTAEYNGAIANDGAAYFNETSARGDSGRLALQHDLNVQWTIGNDTSPQLRAIVRVP